MIECVDPSVVPIADCPARGSVLLLTTAQNVESITVVDQSLQAVTASRPDYLLLPPDLMGMSDANYLFVATTDFDRIDAISDSAYSNSVMQLATQDAAALELARDLAFQDAGLDLHDDSSPIGNAATGAEIGGVSQRFDDITRRLSGYFYGYILGLLAIAMFVGVLLETMYHARTTRILAETGASRRTVASAFMVASLLPSLLCLLCAVVVGYFVGARYAAWTDYSVNLHVFGPGILAAGLLLIVLSGAASALATHHLV